MMSEDTNQNLKSNRIQTLDEEVIDQIAAGEVVERPSHLVKELIENSMDAGATEISIEFSDGGRSVVVSDNGVGIHPEDLSKALERHATSKITNMTDLWNLSSFGFRGEALASISSVSDFKLSSRAPLQTSGFLIESHFGRSEKIQSIGHEPGTKIQIKDLFQNIPARLKFLKSNSSEYTQIKNVIKAMALSTPMISFRVIQDQLLQFFWPAVDSKLSRAQQILQIDQLFKGQAVREGVKATSIFASPHQTAKTTRQIWMFAQNRWIQDRGIQAAVLEAYRHLLMHGEYPIAMTWVEVDPATIDVNIHPTKSQVKFLDPSLVFRAVQASIRDVLELAPWVEKKQTPAVYRVTDVIQNHQQIPLSEPLIAVPTENLFEKTVFQKKETPKIPHIQNLKSPLGYWSNLQVLAQAHLTYLVCQDEKEILFIDQHAAHERVMFEKLMASFKGGRLDIQNFLFPLVLDLTSDRIEVLEKQRTELAKLGIVFERLGPESLGVQSAPMILKEQAIVRAMTLLAEDLLIAGDSHRMEKAIGEVCATMACHSAIRAGQALSQDEMKSLLLQMDEFPLSSFCPHGRTVSVKYPIYQLEKEFGRIL